MKKSEASMLCIRRIESFTTATPAVISMFRASPLFTAVQKACEKENELLLCDVLRLRPQQSRSLLLMPAGCQQAV